MKLVSNWRAVVRKSLSFWGNILIAVAMGIAGGFSVDGTFYWSMAVANFAVAILRLIFQKGFSDE
ncbi:hypothetical protein HJB79_31545 [Rhizobium lentis]|uniref:hypothetical protein n=1 Tax=Rhizobium lentis TaxID=1138194 RepID=UPI001C8301E6|nr:hypothetical protein [Rhizobium lentis]MBX5143245.1 hypothetical protein [Rhizobium lentis]